MTGTVLVQQTQRLAAQPPPAVADPQAALEFLGQAMRPPLHVPVVAAVIPVRAALEVVTTVPSASEVGGETVRQCLGY